MKAIRRSLKNEKTDPRPSHQPRPSLQQKAATAIIPPKKVIKALYDYEPSNKNGEELAFHKGDFFHVIDREDDTEWYEACNPMIPTAKGLVPVAFFEVIGKQQQRQSGQSQHSNPGHDSGFSEKGLSAATTLIDSRQPADMAAKGNAMHSRGMSSARAGAMVYGVVLYDFVAERADELQANGGEAIIIVAQSNPEWFVAKPIGRLGGPGLIPVSFVEIKDTVTGKAVPDPVAAVKAAGVPRVEEWKKTAAEYKNNSISLGQINTPQIGGAQQPPQTQQITQGMDRVSLQNQRPQQQSQRQQQHHPPQQNQAQAQHLLSPIKASVPRYCFDNDMYWYIIEAQMSDGRWWELSRYYADFYDFQRALLDKFPDEAGRGTKQRTLPYMPGPVAHVTDAISNGRRENLDLYIKALVDQPDHIREDIHLRRFFAPKPSQDYEIDPSALEDEFRLSGHSLAPTQSRQSSGAGSMQQHNAYNSMPPPPSSAPRNGNHQPRPSQGQQQGPGPYHTNGGPVQNHQQPPLHSQTSNLTQNSTGSKSSLPAPTTAGTAGAPIALGPQIRIKLETNSDVILIRVPESTSFDGLIEKICDRLMLGEDVPTLQYRDDQAGMTASLSNDKEWNTAKQNRSLRILVNKS